MDPENPLAEVYRRYVEMRDYPFRPAYLRYQLMKQANPELNTKRLDTPQQRQQRLAPARFNSLRDRYIKVLLASNYSPGYINHSHCALTLYFEHLMSNDIFTLGEANRQTWRSFANLNAVTKNERSYLRMIQILGD